MFLFICFQSFLTCNFGCFLMCLLKSMASSYFIVLWFHFWLEIHFWNCFFASGPGKGTPIWNWYQTSKRFWSQMDARRWELPLPCCCWSSVWGLWSLWFDSTNVHWLHGTNFSYLNIILKIMQHKILLLLL